jgi:hypothetical protein
MTEQDADIVEQVDHPPTSKPRFTPRAEDYLAVSCSGKVGFGAEIAAAGGDGHYETT